MKRRLAGTVRVSHLIFVYATAVAAIFSLPAGLEPGVVFACLSFASMVVGQTIFKGDCPLSIIEYCLRGLGGEDFNPSQFYTMSALAAEGVPTQKIYHQLLRQSSVYTLLAGAVITTATLAAIAFF